MNQGSVGKDKQKHVCSQVCICARGREKEKEKHYLCACVLYTCVDMN